MVPASNKAEVLRRYAKYVFLDVVKFSKRSAEAQSDIVNQLNLIIGRTLEDQKVKSENCILIPTGDGMCIALIGPHLDYDLHIRIALGILEALDAYNNTTTIQTRQFQVRIGINQNTDILITDINGRENIAGAGINMASRIMDKADGCQILISQTVYDELQPTELYMDRFHPFDAEGKHGLRFRVYQYVDGSHIGLNCTTPTEFEKKQPPEPKLPKLVAYYFANAIKHRQFIIKHLDGGHNDYSSTVWLWSLAKDSMDRAEATELKPYVHMLYGNAETSSDDIFTYYESIDFFILMTLANFISDQLSQYKTSYLESGGYGYMPIFANDCGIQKLKKDWPDIWEEFGLGKL